MRPRLVEFFVTFFFDSSLVVFIRSDFDLVHLPFVLCFVLLLRRRQLKCAWHARFTFETKPNTRVSSVATIFRLRFFSCSTFGFSFYQIRACAANCEKNRITSIASTFGVSEGTNLWHNYRPMVHRQSSIALSRSCCILSTSVQNRQTRIFQSKHQKQVFFSMIFRCSCTTRSKDANFSTATHSFVDRKTKRSRVQSFNVTIVIVVQVKWKSTSKQFAMREKQKHCAHKVNFQISKAGGREQKPKKWNENEHNKSRNTFCWCTHNFHPFRMSNRPNRQFEKKMVDFVSAFALVLNCNSKSHRGHSRVNEQHLNQQSFRQQIIFVVFFKKRENISLAFSVKKFTQSWIENKQKKAFCFCHAKHNFRRRKCHFGIVFCCALENKTK